MQSGRVSANMEADFSASIGASRRTRGRLGAGRGVAADEKIFERAKAGDREALGSLLAAEADACYAVALRLAGGRERAEEIVQEAATRSVRSFERCRSAGSFRPWLLRLVVCTAADAVAARQRRARVERRYAMERAERLSGGGDGRAELREHLERALASLEEHHRMPLVLPGM